MHPWHSCSLSPSTWSPPSCTSKNPDVIHCHHQKITQKRLGCTCLGKRSTQGTHNYPTGVPRVHLFHQKVWIGPHETPNCSWGASRWPNPANKPPKRWVSVRAFTYKSRHSNPSNRSREISKWRIRAQLSNSTMNSDNDTSPCGPHPYIGPIWPNFFRST